MSTQAIIGMVLLAVGIALLFFGWQSSQSVGDQISETFTGRFTESTMVYLIAGIAAAVAGAVMAFRK